MRVFTAVLHRPPETACSSAVEDVLDLVPFGDQASVEYVIPSFDFAVGLGVHVGKSALHRIGWKECHLLEPEGIEDVFLEVLIEADARDALYCHACPIDASPILPSCARFESER